MRLSPAHRIVAAALALTMAATAYALAQVSVIGDDGALHTLGAATTVAAKAQIRRLKAGVFGGAMVVAGIRSL